MRVAGMVLGLAIFAAVGVIMIGPVSTVVADNTGTTTVTNETVNADYNESVDLRGYDIDQGTVTVYGFNDTSGAYEVASSPGDYSLNTDPGELDVNASSTLIQDGEEVKVSYDYQAAGTIATLVIGFVPLALGLLIFVGISQRVTGAL